MTALLDTITADSPLLRLDARLQRELATKRDLVVDSPLVTLAVAEPTEDEPTPTPTLALAHPREGDLSWRITDHAHGQIGDHLGIPTKLYKRLLGKHPDLLADLANGLLDREPSKRMLRTMDGNLRAFLSNKYRPRDNHDLLREAILPALDAVGRPVDFKACELTDTRMYVKIVLPDFELPITPKVGDVMRGGLIVRNSEVGSGALQIAPYTDILWCTNGAVHTEFGQRSAHIGRRIENDDAAWEFYSDETIRLDDAAFFAKCRDTVTAVLNEQVFQAIAQQMRDLAAITLDNPAGTVEDVTRRHDFTEVESSSILSALIADYDATAWGLVGAITQTARDLESADRRYEIEALAGRMMADPTLLAVSA